MSERIFAGRETITFKDYMDFRNELQELLWHFEFHQFNVDDGGAISSFDFAQSFFVHYLPVHKIDEHMNHLMSFDEYKLGCVDIDQYVAFQYFLKLKDKIMFKVSNEKRIDYLGMRELCDEFEKDKT